MCVTAKQRIRATVPDLYINNGNLCNEFRHKSWWTQEVFERLHKHKISYSGQSYPGDLPEHAVVNHKIIYYRFHGRPVLYKSAYKNEDLQQVLDQIGEGRKKAFIYFNNTWGSAALTNSREMQRMVNKKIKNGKQ